MIGLADVRRLAPEAAIGMAVAGAIYVGLALPAQRSLEATAAQSASLREQARRLDQINASIPGLSSQRQQVDEIVARVAHASRLAAAPAELYDWIDQIADRHDLTIERRNPGTPRPVQSTAARTPDAPPDPTRANVVTYSLTLIGSYGSVVAFLDELGHGGGFVRVRSARITPIENAEHHAVSATVTVDFYEFRWATESKGVGQ